MISFLTRYRTVTAASAAKCLAAAVSYQDAFLTPGIFPCSAMSRKITREIPKYRI